ncbi:hypothetical protein GOP47_0000187 [Adiantum capillus-veneris]|uniref:RING-type E3 ubiquitin transferase n=1 Tax=Adiantum capillus-veneris TaxID=13818 RepID=A0A9D4VEH5_ADICA|nr:hypothetical protein GOP47_0000187 [Adiantum capillus-veneris]
MELNKRADMNDPPLLAIGRPSYDLVSTENEHQAGAGTWSPMDCNGVGPSSMNDIWHADWRPYSGDLSHTHSAQAQHRAKRQHCWGATSLISEEQGVGPSSLHDEDSMKSLRTELFGCCETANTGNTGFDFFQSTPNSASTSRSPCPPHGLMLVNNSRQATASGTGHWNAGVAQGTGLSSFFAEGDWKITRDLMSSESTESKKGKGVDHFHTNAGGSGIEISGCQELSYFPNALEAQPENEKGKSGSPIDCMSKLRAEEVQGDFRGAYKRKISPVDFVESSPFDSHFTASNESAASRAGGSGIIPDQFGFTNFPPIGSLSTTPFWGSHHDLTEHASNESSTGIMERTSGFIGSCEDATRNLHNQPSSIASDTQSQSHLPVGRTRRSALAHSSTRRNLDSENGNATSSTSLLIGSDHWPSLGGERSPAPLPATANWGPSGSRRNGSAFTSPGSRDRGSFQGALEGSRFRNMPGRTLDWAMAAATAAAAAPAPAPSELRPSQLFAGGGVAGPSGREVDLPESSTRISQAANSFFNSGVLASYFPTPGSNTHRFNMNAPPAAISAAPSHQILAGPPLEASMPGAGQHASRYTTLSPSRGRREAVFPAPVQSLLGLPFRGMNTLRADGEYRRQFLSEILNAMHHAFRSEDLNIEDLVMLDPSIIYGGGDAHDQHRDMRLDVDNMTYEELLALEERIGNVSTGLDEEKVSMCIRESKYSSLDATVAAISQDSDVKCSVCQEEFVEEDELGRLDCGHGYHSGCIRQWLLQKNECPICKASAYMKP